MASLPVNGAREPRSDCKIHSLAQRGSAAQNSELRGDGSCDGGAQRQDHSAIRPAQGNRRTRIRLFHRRAKSQGPRAAWQSARVTRTVLATQGPAGPRRRPCAGSQPRGGRRLLGDQAAAEPACSERFLPECPTSLPRRTSRTVLSARRQTQRPRSPTAIMVDWVSSASRRDRILDPSRASPARPGDLPPARSRVAT